MKKIKSIVVIIPILILTFSCSKKEETIQQPEQKWEFTRLVNINRDALENTLSLDFYQKKATQWRVVQMEPDDYTKFNLKDIKTPTDINIPVKDANAYLTVNSYFLSPTNNLAYYNGNTKWAPGDLPTFGSFYSFLILTPDMPTASNQINKYQGATYSFEQPYNKEVLNHTYIFYDFTNQKYTYYGTRTGADLVLENKSLSSICSTCKDINWSAIDAVTCTKTKAETSAIYYFFDFDAKKMFILHREGLNTDNPRFLSNYETLDFSEAFKGKYGQPGANTPFDFTK